MKSINTENAENLKKRKNEDESSIEGNENIKKSKLNNVKNSDELEENSNSTENSEENEIPSQQNNEFNKILCTEKLNSPPPPAAASAEEPNPVSKNEIEEFVLSSDDESLSNTMEGELSDKAAETILKATEDDTSDSGAEQKTQNPKNKSTDNGNSESKRVMNVRKNIRDLMNESTLDPMTLNAQKEESERLARLQEQQRLIRAQSIRAYQLHQQQQLQQRLQQQQQQYPSSFHQNSVPQGSHHSSASQSHQVPPQPPPPYYYPHQSSTSNYNYESNYNGTHCSPSSSTYYSQQRLSRPLNDYYDGAQKYPYDGYHKKYSRIPPKSAAAAASSTEVVTISDDDDDDDDNDEDDDEKNNNGNDKDDDDDDAKSSSSDDCVILSDNEEHENNEDDANNSGIHVNDMYNIPDEEGRVLVNIGHPDKEPDIFLAEQISRAIKPHQIGGVRFLYDNIIESIERFKTSTGFGCILAHSMGLGKTLQLVSFCDIFLRHTTSKTVLCIMPINTLQNWLAEFDKWLPSENNCSSDGGLRSRNFKIFVLNDQYKNLSARAKVILDWSKTGGVLLIGYELFRLLSMKMTKNSKKDKNKSMCNKSSPTSATTPEAPSDENSKLFDDVYGALVKPGPDLVVCDEGHRIKNSHASVSIALKQINTKRRVVLTGYPLQNNLLEYWCMVDFVRPNYLGTKSEFSNMFERPIQNGQCIDSTPEDKKLMRYRSHVLHSLLLGFVQRRSNFVLESALPKKEEYIILLKMGKFQRQLYDTFMNEVVRKRAVPNPLKAFAVCCKIWNHTDVLYNFLKNRDVDDLDLLDTSTIDMANKKANKSKIYKSEDKIDEKFEMQKHAGDDSLESQVLNSQDKNLNDYYLNYHNNSKSFKSLNSADDKNSEILDLDGPDIKNLDISGKYQKDDAVSYTWAKDLLKGYCTDLMESSPKMTIFFCLLNESVNVGDRLLLFSQSLLTLNVIETFLSKSTIPKSDGKKWKRNVSYFRLDGSTSPMEREKLINEFNKNPGVHLFLVSTKAGSLGINLVGANRVIVFDASWNPCHDAQAICRVYRYGQQKPCFIYRFVMDNCLEKKIYDRQVNKQGISDRIVDECNPDAHLLLKEVTNLCFDDIVESPPVNPDKCKNNYSDALIQKIIEINSEHLSKEPFFHESLLVDRKEKKLSLAEKRLAQRSYEMEKRASSKSNFNFSGMMFYQSTPNSIKMTPNRYVDSYNKNNDLNSQPHIEKYGVRPTRWIPAEIWQRQGMSAKEMYLPTDVSIPTSGRESNIMLKAGQKVMVLKSMKGIYMQLESGKIIAIRAPISNNNNYENNRHMPSSSISSNQTHHSNSELKNLTQRSSNLITSAESIEIQDLTGDDPDDVDNEGNKSLRNGSGGTPIEQSLSGSKDSIDYGIKLESPALNERSENNF